MVSWNEYSACSLKSDVPVNTVKMVQLEEKYLYLLIDSEYSKVYTADENKFTLFPF